MKSIVLIGALFLSLVSVKKSFGQETLLKPRLVVCTDIAPAHIEPDDMESMIHLLSYADCFEIEALITSVGWNCDPYPAEWHQYLTRAIEAYRKDVNNLKARSGQKYFLPMKLEATLQTSGFISPIKKSPISKRVKLMISVFSK